MAKEKRTLWHEFSKGLLTENPVLRLTLGTCPALAVTTCATNALGMGVAATAVLVCSNIAISAMRNIIPDKVRIPAYITIIAGFVTAIQMLVKAFAPAIDESLGIFLPLIVVNCIILGRAEMFASKHNILASAVDGLGMGVGFTAALLCMGIIREALGSGTFFSSVNLPFFSPGGIFEPMIIFILAPGGFFTFGILIAIANRLGRKKPVGQSPCEFCTSADTCLKKDAQEDEV